MYRQPAVHFGDVQKAIALAMHASGSTDTEIGLELGVSVNNIIHWRGENGLRENRPASAEPAPVRRVASAGDRPKKETPADFGFEGVPSIARAPQFSAGFGARGADLSSTPLLSPAEAQIAYVKPVQPEGDNALELGLDMDRKVYVDLEELRTTRLLVQGNSGSGKSHLLRKLMEESTGIIQQVIIDPEGDFVSLGETFGHTIIDAGKFAIEKIGGIAARVRQHRGSVVLNLEALDMERQMDFAAAFLGGLFDAPTEHWFPALVFVDEAQIFAPAADNGESKETRKASQQAMTDLMCRGRKRGLAGIIATQRLAKLHKNVAAEASNFLMGRTFLDIDIGRAGDLLGLRPAAAEAIRDLKRGEFLGLGPAISRRPLKVKIGDVITAGKALPEQGLAPLPAMSAEELQSLMLTDEDEEQPSAAPAPVALRIVK